MKSVYIHIPFCKTICSYCDFCKVYYDDKNVANYLKVLKEEIEDFYNGEAIESIYIGGGTPSCLPIPYLKKVFALFNCFNVEALKEVTFECNLNDINEALLLFLKGKVNRLSIGIQSFNSEKLKIMGRNHTFKEALEKMSLCRCLGFSNINVDFIYGFKEETIQDMKKDLKRLLKLKPNHISTYSLMIENHTLLKINNYQRCSDEKDAFFYKEICKVLKKEKFHHYEVSNFALKGCASIHNLRYWQNKEYYGFGVSASGYIDHIRYTNTLSLTKYMKGEFIKEREILTQKDIMDYHLMLGFRLVEGFSIEAFENLYQVKLEERYPIKPLLKNKDLMIKKGKIFINPDKLYVMNEILIKMI
ncbi:MAG: radical SAM family heme chaperone HemW [Bacilli bacterium]|nr:radical SAM family heme chaperone HemW [Bacilli bacterium]